MWLQNTPYNGALIEKANLSNVAFLFSQQNNNKELFYQKDLAKLVMAA